MVLHMLSAREILQIDATILAGIFILMTIISFSGGSLYQQLQQTTDNINKLEQLKPQKQILEQKLNGLLQNASRYSYEANLTSGNDAEFKLLEMNNAMNEYNRTQQELYSLENQLSQESQLLETQNQTADKINKRNAEALNLFSKDPEIWLYRVGITFSISAFLAIFLSIFEEQKNSRRHYLLTTSSIGFMAAGFIFLILVFISIVIF